MSATSQCTWAAQIGATIALIIAASEGNATVHSNGLHVPLLAYDSIGLTMVGVCLVSCVNATVSLSRVVALWHSHDAVLFYLSSIVAWLAASTYANAPPGFSINGASPDRVGWPAMLWLLVLLGIFTMSACRSKKTPLNQSVAPNGNGGRTTDQTIGPAS